MKPSPRRQAALALDHRPVHHRDAEARWWALRPRLKAGAVASAVSLQRRQAALAPTAHAPTTLTPAPNLPINKVAAVHKIVGDL